MYQCIYVSTYVRVYLLYNVRTHEINMKQYVNERAAGTIRLTHGACLFVCLFVEHAGWFYHAKPARDTKHVTNHGINILSHTKSEPQFLHNILIHSKSEPQFLTHKLEIEGCRQFAD